MHVSQIKEPLPENRPMSKIRNPIPLRVEKKKKKVSLLPHRGRIVNACGAGDGTSRRCAPTRRGRLSCVTDDTGATKTTRHLRDWENLRACVIVHVACWPSKSWQYRQNPITLTGERREPARGKKRTLKSLILSLHAVYSFQSKMKLEG